VTFVFFKFPLKNNPAKTGPHTNYSISVTFFIPRLSPFIISYKIIIKRKNSKKMRMSAKTHKWLMLLFIVSTVGGPLAVSAKKSTGDDEGTCDADAIISAGKRLSEELVAMKNVEGLRTLSEVSRTWKLVRNQQQQVEDSFVEVNTRFSTAVRKLTGVKTIKTDDKAKVEALFLSGDPFFVQCAAPVDQLHRTFIDSAAGLVEAGVTPAVIDCNGKLPSGRTVMQRFFAGKTLEVFFCTANETL
jgi:hypothetical protein